MSRTTKVLYQPLSLAASVAVGLLAGAVFNQLWKAVNSSDDPPPDPDDLTKSTRSTLAAAALQGLVFGLVRGAVNRASAKGYRAVTRESPPK
ncbi:DUF4235 domain-containing protein [Mycolicibacterium arenosum]|uniref:DUF4235 domain-containing protein n=1 Tax=Mycolicibacterium arenosum TaxID=2952157 RepID=A0ABT1M4W8_9MYCO|nr:DUF4235 domain-containing protein [Mycolicibacterium sp. CAU 1645]MCP9274216.1 DUF4235 domain-containing protein [Mycolicibacterium sp. CAU 1645]